ncbi:MAG: PLDc N-terminal domain-containing protein [Acidobacteriota bacterium]|nr:PLDc N-terminal domain-containing protein [Acidobacteriota bacterium]
MIGFAELIVLLVVISLILFIISLIDILRHRFPGKAKPIWILVIIILPIVGPVLYFFLGRKHRIK